MIALSGCASAPEKPAPLPPEPVVVAPPPAPSPAVAEPPKSVMFDSDPNGEWNLFPDPTSGEVGVYHKGDYLGAVTGSEKEDPPIPHKSKGDRNVDPDNVPDSYR